MKPLTCEAAVHLANDQLTGLLSNVDRAAFEGHLAGCNDCSCLMNQLQSTVGLLRSRPQLQLNDSVRDLVAGMEGGRADVLTAQLPHLYALASALDANTADDLVQDTLASALADPESDTSGSGLAAALERLAAAPMPEIQSPVAPAPGMDPDADEAELFYPDFYTDGPDAGAWVDPPVVWGEARVLRPDDALVTVETYGAVNAALTKLDPIDVGLLSLVDIESAPFSRAVMELELSPDEARERLARARFAVRAALDRNLRR